MNTTAPQLPHAAPQSATPSPIAPLRRGSASPDRPSWSDVRATVPILDAPAFYGPPITFVLGPWLLLVLLLIGPFALLLTVLLALAVAAGVLAVCVAVIASPYLLIRHLHAHGIVDAKRVHPSTCSAHTGSALPGSAHHNRMACHEDRGYRRQRTSGRGLLVDAEVARVRIGGDVARIVAGLRRAADELVEAELFGSRDLDKECITRPHDRPNEGCEAGGARLAGGPGYVRWPSRTAAAWPAQRVRVPGPVAVPPLRKALGAFRSMEGLTARDVRWLWLACRLAQDLWDDELWHVLATRGVRIARRRARSACSRSLPRIAHPYTFMLATSAPLRR